MLALDRVLEGEGLSTRRVEVRPGRPNLYCSLPSHEGGGGGRHLILCGHTDTVPLNAAEPGHGTSGEVRDGRLHGRGAADMKGALAAMAGALVSLLRAGGLRAGRVTLAAVIDEEMESLGAEELVSSGERADGAIIGEATSNRVAVGHKGLEWLEIVFRGKSAHGGRPEAGVSAISAAARFIQLAERELSPRFEARAHPVLGPPTFNVGTIAGGDQPSTVPAECLLRVDRRSVPGETYDGIVAELEGWLEKVKAGLPGLATEIRRMPGSMATLEHVALVTEASHPLVVAAASACEAVAGAPCELTTFPAWTDGALLSRYAGIPAIVLGPGDLALAHSPRESVLVSELVDAARIYASAALAFCQ